MVDVVFLGTPEAAVPSLSAVVDAGHQVRLVVSQPDRRRGRGASLAASPVKREAQRLGLATTDQLADVLDAGAALGVVVAFGKIVPQLILDRLPMVNVHFSLLPRWRGAAPVERAILSGDPVTGVCLMRLEAGLDTGPVLDRVETPVAPEEHVGELTERLARLGADLLVQALARGVDTWGGGMLQEGEPTYAAKIAPGELEIDWRQPVEQVLRQVRLDRAYTTFRGQRLRVLDARSGTAAGDGVRSGDVVSGGPTSGSGRRDGARSDSAVSSGPTRGGVRIRGEGADDPTSLGARALASVGAAPPGSMLPVAQVVTGDGVVQLLRVQPEGRRPVDAVAWWHGARTGPGEQLGSVAAVVR